MIRDAGAVPSFKGYHGYPATICSSVNEQVVHAIPAPKQVLRDGDLISIDCGAILDGWHGDAAISVLVGDRPARPERAALIDAAEEALWAGIAAAARGGAVRTRAARATSRHAIEASIRAAQGGTASCAGTAGTASAARCTRSRSCSTTAGRVAGRAWCRGCAWRSSRC